METGTALWSIDLKPGESATSDERRAEVLANPGFAKFPTDHMVHAVWTEDEGWHDAELVPYAPISFDPSTNFMHYGQAIFEGLKAYRWADGSVKTFRPFRNAERFAGSARRLAMAELPEELFVGSIEALVRQDAAWVPAETDKSLYLRPFMLGTEVGLGIRPSSRYDYYLIAAPAGAYFPNGIKPVTV